MSVLLIREAGLCTIGLFPDPVLFLRQDKSGYDETDGMFYRRFSVSMPSGRFVRQDDFPFFPRFVRVFPRSHGLPATDCRPAISACFTSAARTVFY